MIETEIVKRLEPTKETIREIALKSGNQCAFPGCDHIMMTKDGKLIGQVCHIEAAEPNGQRFNPNMTNEQRRQPSNLMLMCYPHHVITNDVDEYPTPRLWKIKDDHESRFTGPSPVIGTLVRDWTRLSDPTYAHNLRRLNRVCNWNLSSEELETECNALTVFIRILRNVPVETRQFLRVLVERISLMQKTGVVKKKSDALAIRCSDLQNAFQLSGEQVVQYGIALEDYELGDLSYEYFLSSGRELPAITIFNYGDSKFFLMEAVKFCEQEKMALATLIEDLDFSVLDE